MQVTQRDGKIELAGKYLEDVTESGNTWIFGIAVICSVRLQHLAGLMNLVHDVDKLLDL